MSPELMLILIGSGAIIMLGILALLKRKKK